MTLENKLIDLINDEARTQHGLTDERDILLNDVLLMVVRLNKNSKLKDLAQLIQSNFPQYGNIFKNE